MTTDLSVSFLHMHHAVQAAEHRNIQEKSGLEQLPDLLDGMQCDAGETWDGTYCTAP